MATKLGSLGLVVSAIVIWSATEVLLKLVQTEVTPVLVAFVRVLLGVAVLAGALTLAGGLGEAAEGFARHRGAFVLLGGIVAVSFVTFIAGVNLTRASTAAVIVSTNPVFVAILAARRGERVTRHRFVGILVGLLGLLLVATELKALESLLLSGFFTGNLLVLLACVLWSVYTICVRGYAIEMGSLPATLFGLAIGALFMSPAVVLVEDVGSLLFVPATTWGCLAFLGVVSTGLCHVLFFRGMRGVEASRGITPFYLKPALSSALARLLLGEPLTLWLAIGLVVITVGIILAQM